MTYYIQYNENSKHHYDVVRPDGSVTELTSKTTDNYLKMPSDVAEATNRRLVSIKMIENNMKNGQFELTVSDRVRQTSTSEIKVSKNTAIEDDLKYLSDEEQEVFKSLMAKIKKAREIEVAKAKLDAALAEYERIKKEAQA